MERAWNTTRQLDARIDAIEAALALSGALRADGVGGERIEAILDEADGLVEATGAHNFEPLLLVERAELAGLAGDAEGRTPGLRRALGLFDAISASGHAARVAGQLDAPPS